MMVWAKDLVRPMKLNVKWCYDTQHNDTQLNDTQHNDTKLNDTQHSDNWHNYQA